MRKFYTIAAGILFAMNSFAQSKLNMELFSHWDSDVVPHDYKWTYTDIWGYAKDGKEYAIVGSNLGVHVIDVDEKGNPKELHYVPGNLQDTHPIHRDVKMLDNYIYMVCDEGASALKIIDVSGLPESIDVVYDSDELIVHGHNIYIDTVNRNLYVCGGILKDKNGNNQFNSLACYSLEDPENPVLIKKYNQPYCHDMYIDNATNTLVSHQGYTGMTLYDISNPANPIELGGLESYPHQGYNHAGWLADDGKTYYFADENNGKDMKTIDISDPSDIQVLGRFTSGIDDKSMAHNALVKGDVLFVSYYQDGAYMFDIRNPATPVVLGYYDTYDGTLTNYQGNWGIYPYLPSGKVLALDTKTGLYVLDPTQAYAVLGVNEYEKINLKLKTLENRQYELTLPNLEQSTIQITDIQGKLIKQFETQNQVVSFDLQGLSSASYLIRIHQGEKKYIQKIIAK